MIPAALCLTLTLASPDPPEGFEPGWGPALLAAGPGLIVHGLGHMVAGDTDTGLDLLLLEGVGLGLLVGGTGALAATGASRRIAGPNILGIGAGFGLFATSWLADVTGAAGLDPGGRRPAAPFEPHLGYRYVFDPQFEYRHFAVLGIDSQLGRLGLDADAWIAADDANWRLRHRTRWRLAGEAAGSSLEARGGLGWHAHETEGFAFMTLEGRLDGRSDLRWLSPTLAGAFVEGGGGWAIELYEYDVPGTGFGEDVFDMLLFRFAYGLYVPGGEALIEYDHRRDSFASGLGLDGIGVGAIGSFGARGRVHLDEGWALDLQYAVGSAHVAGLGLRWRGGR